MIINIGIVDDRSAIAEKLFALVQSILKVKEIAYLFSLSFYGYHPNPILSKCPLTLLSSESTFIESSGSVSS